MLTRIKLLLVSLVLAASFLGNANALPVKNFIAIADVHFDPYVACSNVSPCAFLDMLRAAPVTQWDAILQNYDTIAQPLHQDTNYDLLLSSVAHIKKTAAQNHPSFVLLLGDYLAHDYKKNYMQYATDKSEQAYEDFVIKTNDFLVRKFSEALPHIDVYMAVGNNDTYEDHYVIDSDGKFFHDMAQSWSAAIANPNNRSIMQREFATGGYYAVTVPQDPHLHLIVLNSVLFSAKAQGSDIEKQAQDQMDFLKNELQDAQQHHQKVLIALHIPAGIDVFTSLKNGTFHMTELWNTTYTLQFQALMEQFQAEILGVLAGHAHVDWFEIIKTKQGDLPISGVPSISPIIGNNPGYKTYLYTDQALTDFITYTFALTKNKQWQMEYQFNAVYQRGCKQCELLRGMENIRQTGPLADAYQNYFDGGEHAQPIAQSWMPYYFCQIEGVTGEQYQDCLAGKV